MLVLLAPTIARAVSTALVVVFASVLAEAIGPFWGALITCLPISSGPAYVFLALRHDGDFVAASALGSLAANAATGGFLIVYAMTARRLPLWRGLGAAMATWFVASLIIRQIVWTPVTAMLLNAVVYGVGFLVLRGAAVVPSRSGEAVTRRWFDLPLRATAVALFVSGVVLASSVLGPEATGIVTVFPISLTSLFIILQPRIGGPASAVLAATTVRAMLGFGLALLALHLATRPLGVAAALCVGLLVSIAWSGGLLALRGRLGAGAAAQKCKP
jgi:hypothetical protein